MSVGFYAFSYKNPIRKARLEKQFINENIPLIFTEPVENTDPRLAASPENIRRTWAIMWSHLDSIKIFTQSTYTHAVFCEDDLIIRRSLHTYIQELIAAFDRRNLDIMLLSYLTTSSPAGLVTAPTFKSSDRNLIYLEYDDNLWGAHMYMLSQASAQRLLNIYTQAYAEATLTNNSLMPFSPDWTLTKNGKRALVYPLMGLEEGTVNTSDTGQVEFHRNCFKAHYDPAQFY
jgi:hypothetical protein